MQYDLAYSKAPAQLEQSTFGNDVGLGRTVEEVDVEVRGHRQFDPTDRTQHNAVHGAVGQGHQRGTRYGAARSYRIWMVGHGRHSEESLIIYPDGFRAGSVPADVPPEQAFAQWLPGHLERDDGERGKLCRQARWVKRLIPDALSLLEDQEVVVLAVFDQPDASSML